MFYYDRPLGYHWSFMLALEDNSFAAVQIDNYGNPRVMDCQFADNIMKLPNWRIDAGGRV